MSTDTANTLGALPEPLEQDRERERLEQKMAEQLAELAHQPPPLGSMRRLLSLGNLQAQAGLIYISSWMRGWFRSAPVRERIKAEAHFSVAVKALCCFSHLRGAIMKIGQTIANQPLTAPAEYVELMEHLHFEAPPMHFSLLRELVRNELGGDPEDIFESFETQAFAAASLGQVHRARLKTGQRVAVKIQYPGIGRTIRSDFANLSAALLPMRLSRDWENLKAQLDDIRRVVELETDYAQEAEFLRQARRLFREDDGIDVPGVHDAFSTPRVLTMDYIEGDHLPAFLARNPPQELCDRYGELIYRALFRVDCTGQMMYSDSHPGNFIFQPNGRLGFIDFGCIRKYSDAELDYCHRSYAAVDGPRDEIVKLLIEGSERTAAEVSSEHLELLLAWWDWVTAPIVCNGAFDFTEPDVVRRGPEILFALTKKRLTRGKTMASFLARGYCSLRAMLHRLKAHVNVKQLWDAERKTAASRCK